MPFPHTSSNTTPNCTLPRRAPGYISFFRRSDSKKEHKVTCTMIDQSFPLFSTLLPHVLPISLYFFPKCPASSAGWKKYGTYRFCCTLLVEAAKTSAGNARAQRAVSVCGVGQGILGSCGSAELGFGSPGVEGLFISGHNRLFIFKWKLCGCSAWESIWVCVFYCLARVHFF